MAQLGTKKSNWDVDVFRTVVGGFGVAFVIGGGALLGVASKLEPVMCPFLVSTTGTIVDEVKEGVATTDGSRYYRLTVSYVTRNDGKVRQFQEDAPAVDGQPKPKKGDRINLLYGEDGHLPDINHPVRLENAASLLANGCQTYNIVGVGAGTFMLMIGVSIVLVTLAWNTKDNVKLGLVGGMAVMMLVVGIVLVSVRWNDGANNLLDHTDATVRAVETRITTDVAKPAAPYSVVTVDFDVDGTSYSYPMRVEPVMDPPPRVGDKMRISYARYMPVGGFFNPTPGEQYEDTIITDRIHTVGITLIAWSLFALFVVISLYINIRVYNNNLRRKLEEWQRARFEQHSAIPEIAYRRNNVLPKTRAAFGVEWGIPALPIDTDTEQPRETDPSFHFRV